MNFLQRFEPTTLWGTEFDRFFNRSFCNPVRQETPGEAFHESENAWILRLDLPGFAKQHVALNVTGRTLQLTAETPADQAFGGKVERQWTLGADVDATAISARMENGVLELTLPKKPEVVEKPTTIEIN